MGQAKPIKRKKPGPVGTGKTAFVGLRLEPKLTAKLDAWAHRNAVSRSEALRRLAEKALACPTAQDGNPGNPRADHETARLGDGRAG
jgi:Ribbon-helix-helix protein, copG family